jgi:hypothetical protein
MTDAIGWVATALFASSYFFKRPAALRRVQAVAAALWVCYGVVIHALPVVAANLIVAALALWSSLMPVRRRPRAEPVVSESRAQGS